ncbi:MAG: TolC family protein [Gemmatimonadaceae bacterium]
MRYTTLSAALAVVMLSGAGDRLGAQAPSRPAPPADSVPLTLEEAVVRALRTGDEVRLAAAQVEAADEQANVARASALPQLRLTSSYSHVFENARAQAVGSIFNQPNTYVSNLNLSQTVFQGGREWSAIRAASHNRDALRFSAEETRSQVALDVQRAYFTALFADRVVAIRQTDVQLAGARLTQVEQFQTAGRAARYDVLRARVERANLEPLLIQAENDRDIAHLNLKRLINVPPDRPVKLTSRLDSAVVTTLAQQVSEDSSGGARRPRVRAAELSARARRDAIGVARADLLPTVSVFFQSGYQAFPAGNSLPRGFGQLQPIDCAPGTPTGRTCTLQNGGWFADRQLGVQLSWALFDGLRTKSNIDLAQAQAKVAELQLAQEREAVALEVETARAELARARSLYEARRTNVAEADEAFRLASLRYSRGLSTQLEVSDAQLQLMTAQIDEARATYDLYISSAELARALGRPVPLPSGGLVPTRPSSLGSRNE